MIDTTITISGFPIHEPMTVFTDLIIACIAIIIYFRLKNSHDQTTMYWSYFFLFLGLATFIGSFSHALFAVHEGWRYKSFWLTMQVINAIGIYFAQQATLISVLQNSSSRNSWKWSYLIQLFAFVVALLIVQKYIVSIIENAVGLIPIMILHYKDRRPFAKTIASGIAVSFIPAFVHMAKLSIHDYFNYNDLAHVFIMISLYIIYRGVRLKTIPLQ